MKDCERLWKMLKDSERNDLVLIIWWVKEVFVENLVLRLKVHSANDALRAFQIKVVGTYDYGRALCFLAFLFLSSSGVFNSKICFLALSLRREKSYKHQFYWCWKVDIDNQVWYLKHFWLRPKIRATHPDICNIQLELQVATYKLLIGSDRQ